MPEHNKITQVLLGKARDVKDPNVFHRVSLVAFLAWVGLGADGLSSSAYGPDEAFRALGTHRSLAIVLVAMTAITIFVISIAYSNLIEHFPGGGGGYLVATKLLGRKAGVVSGCALPWTTFSRLRHRWHRVATRSGTSCPPGCFATSSSPRSRSSSS